MYCQDCDKEMTGDGYNDLIICPDADDLCYEPDAGPVYCGGGMSKEMKMADYFDLPLSMLCRDAYGNELNFEDMSISELQAAACAINNHDCLVDEAEALREALRLKEAECEVLASDISRIVSAAADAYLSGSEQQHVDHLYRVIHGASGKLYNKELGGGDEK